MNRNYIYIAVALVLIITTTLGCRNNRQQHNSSDGAQGSNSVSYSNLLDKQAQEEVSKAMTDAGIAPENVASFLQNVKQFNDAIEGHELVPL